MNASFEPKKQKQGRYSPRNESQSAKVFPSRTIVRAKLEMTEPGDHDEREADAMATAIMNGGKISRKISSGASGSSGIAVSHQMERQLAHLQGSGRQMPQGLRNMMESGFGRDFSQVRLHTDSEAASMSSSIHAKAFTHGNDIYFNRGQFAPETSEGQKLMAHELTHVVQGTGKVGREDIPMKEIVEANQYYCKDQGKDQNCQSYYNECQGNYNRLGEIISGDIDSIYENLKAILKEVDTKVKFDVSSGFTTATYIASTISGVATVVAAIPAASLPAGIIAGISSIASTIFNVADASMISDINKKNDLSSQLIDIISYNTKKYLLDLRKPLKEGKCEDGKIVTSDKDASYEGIRLILLRLQDYYSKKDDRVNEFVSDITKARNIASISFREPYIYCDFEAYCEQDNGYMLAKVGQDLFVVEEGYSSQIYSILYKFDTKYPMPDNKGLKQYLEEKYLSNYKELVPVQKPSRSFTSYSSLHDFIDCVTDQSESVLWKHKDYHQYNLVPKEYVFSEEDAFAIARGFKHKSWFSSCIPENVQSDFRRSIFSAYESEKEAYNAYGEYLRTNDFCNGIALSLNYDLDGLLETNKVYFKAWGKNLYSSKQIAFLKQVLDKLDIDY